MSDIEALINEDSRDNPMRLRLFRAIAHASPERRSYLTLPLLKRLVAQEVAEDEMSAVAPEVARLSMRGVYALAEYLASERIGVLESHFQFIRADDTAIVLDDGHVGDALQSGHFFDPDTGDEILDWRSRVVVFYTPSGLLAQVSDGR